jgi:Fic family protein
MLDGFEGKLTTSKYAAIEKTSPDTALRDITDPVERGILTKDETAAAARDIRLPR